jgi:hypothetical protein
LAILFRRAAGISSNNSSNFWVGITIHYVPGRIFCQENYGGTVRTAEEARLESVFAGVGHCMGVISCNKTVTKKTLDK